jgi:hypothetical protein
VIISRKKKFIFAAFNKTGTTSIEKSLKKYRNRIYDTYLRHRYRQLAPDSAVPFQHVPPRLIQQLAGDDFWKECFTATFVRNPWDRIVSVYLYHKQLIPNKHPLAAQLTFDDWVRRGGAGSARDLMSRFVCDDTGQQIVDFIGRFERLEDDYEKMCRLGGLDAEALPHEKKTKRRDYKTYYSEETREIVRSWVEKDLEAFGYDYDD